MGRRGRQDICCPFDSKVDTVNATQLHSIRGCKLRCDDAGNRYESTIRRAEPEAYALATRCVPIYMYVVASSPPRQTAIHRSS